MHKFLDGLYVNTYMYYLQKTRAACLYELLSQSIKFKTIYCEKSWTLCLSDGKLTVFITNVAHAKHLSIRRLLYFNTSIFN